MCEGTWRVRSVSLNPESSMSLNQREKVSPLTSSRSCSAILLQTKGSSSVGGSLSTVISNGIFWQGGGCAGVVLKKISGKNREEQTSQHDDHRSGTLDFVRVCGWCGVER